MCKERKIPEILICSPCDAVTEEDGTGDIGCGAGAIIIRGGERLGGTACRGACTDL